MTLARAVLIVSHYGTPALLQETLDGLPGVSSLVELADPITEYARVIVYSDPGFVRFAFERQGYARLESEESAGDWNARRIVAEEAADWNETHPSAAEVEEAFGESG